VRLLALGLALVLTGIALMAAAPMLALLSHVRVGEISGGAVGCVIVFFVPVCFGVGQPAAVMHGIAAAALLLAVLALLTWLLLRALARTRTE